MRAHSRWQLAPSGMAAILGRRGWLEALLLLGTLHVIAGARLLKQSHSSSYVSVSGSPGSVGSIHVSGVGPQGTFSQSLPVSGPTSVSFSSDGGLQVAGADGQFQPFVPGIPDLSTFPPFPPVQIPLPPPVLPSVPALKLPQGPAPQLDLSGISPLDPDYSARVSARVQEYFSQVYAYYGITQKAKFGGSFAGQTAGFQPRPIPATAQPVILNSGADVSAIGIGNVQNPRRKQQKITRRSAPGVDFQQFSASVSGPGPSALKIGSVSTG